MLCMVNKNETQNGQICPRLCNFQVVEPGFKPRLSPDSKLKKKKKSANGKSYIYSGIAQEMQSHKPSHE